MIYNTEPFVFSGAFAELKFYAVKGDNCSTRRIEYISNSGTTKDCANYYFWNATGGYITSMDVTLGDTVTLPDFILYYRPDRQRVACCHSGRGG